MGQSSAKMHRSPSYTERHQKLQQAQDKMVNKIMQEAEKSENKEQDSPVQARRTTEEATKPGVDAVDSKRKMFTKKPNLSFEMDTVFMDAMSATATDYDFPFENLIFEGGGIKRFAYCGACSVLEDYGVMKNIKRFAGTSAGSLYAAFLALGYTSREVAQIITPELASILRSARFGYLSMIPNMLKALGWNSFDPFYKWMGQRFAEKTGNPDITFTELYRDYGKELCVVVTNVNMMCEEYFHPKTTPDVSIRLAVKMSMTLPGLFQPTKFYHHGHDNIYVDGAVLCNFPIHAFDGWWLSMKMEDRYLKRLQPLEECMKLYRHEERFGEVNSKTLGFKIYSESESELDKSQMEEFTPMTDTLPIPDTRLGRKYKKHSKLEKKTLEEHKQIMNAVNAFLKTLEKYSHSADGSVTRDGLEATLKDTEAFPQRYAVRLFGENISIDDVFECLDKDGNGKIQLDELIYFIERTGVNIASRFFGHRWKKVDNVWNFLLQIQNTLLVNIMHRTFRHQDLERTVGINTVYLRTTDFELEQADKDFLFEEGRRRTDAYLRHYVVTKRPRRKSRIPSQSLSSQAIKEEVGDGDGDGDVFDQPVTFDNQPAT